MTPNDINELVERRFLIQCLYLVENDKAKKEDLAEPSRILLALEPFESLEEAKTKLSFMVSKYPDCFTPVLEHLDSIISENNTKEMIDKMHELLKNDQVEEALQIASSHG